MINSTLHTAINLFASMVEQDPIPLLPLSLDIFPVPDATSGLVLRKPDPDDEGPAPPLPVPPLDPGVLHVSRIALISNKTLALMCARSGLWRHMRAG
jgi:hypothetical protein